MEKIEESKEITKNLRILYIIQLIDSRIDEIQKFKKNIPIEINFLEKELHELKINIENIKKEISLLKKNVKKINKNIYLSESKIKKYDIKKNSINNEKELYYINKEIDYKKLEIELFKKNTKKLNIKIKEKKIFLSEKENITKKQKKHIFYKKKELNNTLLKNNKEEKFLLKKLKIYSGKLDINLLQVYKKIRCRTKNGIAVAPVKGKAPIGSYLSITPQKHYELIQRKKILIDEHSGKILIDNELAEEEKMKFLKKKI